MSTASVTSLAFAILVINNITNNIKLNRLASFIKQINVVSLGAVFTLYLGLVSIQGLYVTSFDKFTVKTAKFAVGNFIPVVGGFVSDSLDILLSSSQLIKNVFGGIGLVILAAMALITGGVINAHQVSADTAQQPSEEKFDTRIFRIYNPNMLALTLEKDIIKV